MLSVQNLPKSKEQLSKIIRDITSPTILRLAYSAHNIGARAEFNMKIIQEEKNSQPSILFSARTRFFLPKAKVKLVIRMHACTLHTARTYTRTASLAATTYYSLAPSFFFVVRTTRSPPFSLHTNTLSLSHVRVFLARVFN